MIYEDKKTRSFFIHSVNKNRQGWKVRQKDDSSGKAVSGNVSDEELGKAVREILKNCDNLLITRLLTEP